MLHEIKKTPHHYYIKKHKTLILSLFILHHSYIKIIFYIHTSIDCGKMKLCLLFLCLPTWLCGQNTIGLPGVMNYSKQTYGAGLQNWDIKQDRNGIVYIANNEGLLSYDGRTWDLYPLPNKTIVRSVEISSDAVIYVGGQDEIGFFSANTNGFLEYHSLTKLIPQNVKQFGDVWDIVSFKNDIFFRTLKQVFRYNGNAIEVYNAPVEWSFLGLFNNKMYAHDLKIGLMCLQQNMWKPVKSINELPVDDPVTSMLTITKDSALITTLKNGMYFFSTEGIRKIQSANSALFQSKRIYAATLLNNNWVALATNNDGIYITDLNGTIIQRFSRSEGLQNNNVLSIFLDRQKNLWLGLDNGLDFIAYNSSIKKIIPQQLDGSGYTTLIYNSCLYAGTSNGLYKVPLQPLEDLSFSKGSFSSIIGSQGQVWSLAEINAELLMGHHEGAFKIKEAAAEPILLKPGYWNFIPASGSYPSLQIIAGNYDGIRFFDYQNGQFVPSASISGFNESSRYLLLDQSNNIWVSHPYHGVFRISKKNNGNYNTTSYNVQKGLLSSLNYYVYKIKNKILIAGEEGVYAYDEKTDRFIAFDLYRSLIGAKNIRYLKEDMAGNIWFIQEKTVGVIDISNKTPQVIYFPELKNKMLSGFEFIYPVDDQNIFMGGEKGFYHINYKKYRNTIPELNVLIRKVSISNNRDSILFGGYYETGLLEKGLAFKKNEGISNNWKTIHFDFASTLYGYQLNLEYSYRLVGFDDNWSEWINRTEKEYTNLQPGSYTFEVKVRNNLGNQSAPAAYTFKILPPWYKTNWIKLVYLFLIVCIAYFLYQWQDKRFKLQQTKFEEEQKKIKYIHDLELTKTESELVNLRNEKLESEINFKNSELASSAMHLVKKGELLTKVKTELTQMMKRFENEQATGEVKKMIKSLTEDENIDQEWESFTKHFDKVHSDFVVKLKHEHPDLTGNELKLCTYLRMNLSTKEIAQLLNISVRGVEISRYRLRKKLQIPSEKGLFDYLINLQSK